MEIEIEDVPITVEGKVLPHHYPVLIAELEPTRSGWVVDRLFIQREITDGEDTRIDDLSQFKSWVEDTQRYVDDGFFHVTYARLVDQHASFEADRLGSQS